MAYNAMDAKKLNRVDLFRALLKKGRASRAELSVLLGVSLPTVARLVRELIDLGLVEGAGELPSTGGRKAAAVAPLPDAMSAVGVDVTRNHLSMAAVNLKGELKVHERPVLKYEPTEAWREEAGVAVRGFMERTGVSPEGCAGVGISLPGIISEDGTELLRSHVLDVKRPSRISLPLDSRLTQRLFNDASAGCLTELWGADDPESFFYLSLSNSVGGALVLGGRVFPGDNQRAGEAGHVCLRPGGARCYCGKEGHFDPYGSALNLAYPAGGRLEDFFAKVEGGDRAFAKELSAYLSGLALMVVNLRMLLDCAIVLGGYVGGFLGPYLPRLRTKVTALDSFQNNADYLRLSRRKVEGAAVGAALHFIEEFIRGV
ncbi:MAG: ROK family transcriptional regulator [Deltaproteobacteria bacterium]|jgi:predicted NBD/HSP70 family sugar kinase|nr:ROK family transcriptional regulator [Deltaproteobacteria bacterium]